MLVLNNIKAINHKTGGYNYGTLYYYLIDKSNGSIDYIVWVKDDHVYHTTNANITNITDNFIAVANDNPGLPKNADEYTRIDITPDMIDKNNNNHGVATMLNISDNKIREFHNNEMFFKVEDLISASYEALKFNSTGERKPEPGPEPTPESGKFCQNSAYMEKSFTYDTILGKTAKCSIYSHNNSPIIVGGEKIALENIIAAISENKLLELIKNIK